MHIYAFYPNHSDWIQNLCQQICPHHCGSRPRHSLCPDRYCSSSDFWSLRAAMQNDPQCKYLPLKLKSCLWNFNAKLVQNQVVDSDLKPLMTPSVLIFVIASETLDSSASISWARLPILNCTKRWTIYRTFHKKTSFLWSCIASACTHWNSGLTHTCCNCIYRGSVSDVPIHHHKRKMLQSQIAFWHATCSSKQEP